MVLAVLLMPNLPAFEECLFCDFLIVYIWKSCYLLYKHEHCFFETKWELRTQNDWFVMDTAGTTLSKLQFPEQFQYPPFLHSIIVIKSLCIFFCSLWHCSSVISPIIFGIIEVDVNEYYISIELILRFWFVFLLPNVCLII